MQIHFSYFADNWYMELFNCKYWMCFSLQEKFSPVILYFSCWLMRTIKDVISMIPTAVFFIRHIPHEYDRAVRGAITSVGVLYASSQGAAKLWSIANHIGSTTQCVRNANDDPNDISNFDSQYYNIRYIHSLLLNSGPWTVTIKTTLNIKQNNASEQEALNIIPAPIWLTPPPPCLPPSYLPPPSPPQHICYEFWNERKQKELCPKYVNNWLGLSIPEHVV